MEQQAKKRGRPAKNPLERDTKEHLIRTGIELLTERGYMTADIDSVLKKSGVPKGSFYYYFKNKEEFGQAVIEGYADYFNRKLDKFLGDKSLSPLVRIRAFYENAKVGMAKFDFTRGCLVGNVAQEATILPQSYYFLLNNIFARWQSKFEQCFCEAQVVGELSEQCDVKQLAFFFWIGWEGAVMRAKLQKSTEPLTAFFDYFISTLPNGAKNV